MKEILLETRNLCCSYETSKNALQDVSVQIRTGEKIAVLGSNGAGKSTFFLSLNGILKPRSGEVLLRGKKISHDRKSLLELRKQVGIVFQDPDNQIIASTVMGEISFGPMNLRLPEKEVRRRTEEAMAYMNLSTYGDRSPHYLSGGEKKRVSIADIIAMKSEILLFDEPTASLDPKNAALLEDTLTRLSRDGNTILLSTHDVDFAFRWANRILVFHQGRLLGDGPPEQIFSDSSLLAEASLKRPVLFQVAELLKEKGIIPAFSEEQPHPSDLEQLRKLL